MKYLITGGAGFIGNHFVKYMLNKYPSDSFFVIDLLTYASSLDSLEEVLDKPNLKFIQLDICDKEKLDDLFNIERFDYVINFAAESHVDRSFVYPELFYKTNVEGVKVLLDLSNKYNVKRFHQVSTDEVYGELNITDKESFTEDSPLNPTTPYSKSKAMADKLVLDYFNIYNLDVTISRSTNNFGIYQHPEKLIPKVIKQILNDEEITIYGDGSNVRDWMYVADHCRAIDLILHQGKKGGIYNVGANKELANIDIVKLIIEQLNAPISKITYTNERIHDDKRYSLNCDKIKRELNWNVESNFNDSFNATVLWYKENIVWVEQTINRSI